MNDDDDDTEGAAKPKDVASAAGEGAAAGASEGVAAGSPEQALAGAASGAAGVLVPIADQALDEALASASAIVEPLAGQVSEGIQQAEAASDQVDAAVQSASDQLQSASDQVGAAVQSASDQVEAAVKSASAAASTQVTKAGAAVDSALRSMGLPEVASAGLGVAPQAASMLGEFAGAGAGAGRQALAKVTFSLSVGEGPDAHWMVRRMHFSEALSEPYLLALELVSDEIGTDTESLLGANVELTIERDERARSVCGVVQMVEFVGVADDRLQVRVEVVPALQLLGQRVDTRLWQNARVPDVLEEVLGAAFADYERELDLGNLSVSYPEREYIVQYHESDLDFVSRLMEEEGISYWFDHERGEGKEVMVVEDSADNHLDVATIDDNPELTIIVDRADNAEIESIQHFDWTRELTSTAIYQRVFDWLTPLEPIEASAPSSGGRTSDARGRVREVFEHGRFVEPDPGPRTIRKLLHRRQRDQLARGFGNVIGMAPGRKFELVDHQRSDLDQPYLIRRVTHVADCPEVMLGEAPSDAPRYQNRFECMVLAADNPFRPAPNTRRPKIYGPQTAIVTGPEGEEIHTDEQGRIKVRFDWDRVHALTDDTSMWIRVAHHWAGPGFGTFFLPRIGMEVVVEFLEGDPAKPLVSGCVYNGDNAISVGVPENKTQSTIRTKSSPASDGYNELRFEDAAGSERIFVHAQKDLDETVEHHHGTTVRGSQTQRVEGNQRNSVGGDQSESITRNATLSIDENRTVTIKGSQSVTILGEQANTDISGSKLTITGDYKIDASNTIEIQAPTHIKLTCGGSTITMTPDTIEISAGGRAKLVLDGKVLLESAGASALNLSEDAALGAANGAYLEMTNEVLLGSADSSLLALTTEASLASQAGSQVLLDASALVSGTVAATVTAPTASLAGEAGSVEANPAGVAVSGTLVDVAATGIASISGATVKLN